MKKKTLHNYGCWWSLLLLYSSVAHTSISSLHCPSIPHNGTIKSVSNNIVICLGSYVCLVFQRWFIDGNFLCFSGGHAALGVLAILALGVCIFFTILVALLPTLVKDVVD